MKSEQKGLPWNADAERAALGAMLLAEHARDKAAGSLSAEDFHSERHRCLFQAMLDLHRREEPLDFVTIPEWLRERGLLEKAGGTAFLAKLADEISTSAAIDHHCGTIKEYARRRRVIQACQETMGRAASRSDADELLSFLQGKVDVLSRESDGFGLRKGIHPDNVFTAEKLLEAYQEHVRDISGNVFRTGIHEIDKQIRGVTGGEVLTVIARAGSFKTSLLQNLLIHHANSTKRASVFFSLEMPMAPVSERFQQIIHGSSGQEIEEINRTPEAMAIRVNLEKAFLENLKGLYVVPEPVGISGIGAYCRLIHREYKADIGVIGIDYLGLLNGYRGNEYERLSELARNLKTLAKRLNLPLVVLCQTSRRGGSGDVEISMDMARGSGAIEEAADFVLGLFQVNEEGRQGLVAKILKNRKGPAGSCWLLDLDRSTFRIGPEATCWRPESNRKVKRIGL